MFVVTTLLSGSVETVHAPDNSPEVFIHLHLFPCCFLVSRLLFAVVMKRENRLVSSEIGVGFSCYILLQPTHFAATNQVVTDESTKYEFVYSRFLISGNIYPFLYFYSKMRNLSYLHLLVSILMAISPLHESVVRKVKKKNCALVTFQLHSL